MRKLVYVKISDFPKYYTQTEMLISNTFTTGRTTIQNRLTNNCIYQLLQYFEYAFFSVRLSVYESK